MNGVSPVKMGFVDLAAILFVIGGVVSLVMSIPMIPIITTYPFILPAAVSIVFMAVLAISVICSLGAIHCYSLATKRMLSEAGMRGIIFGALLLILSLGLVGSYRAPDASTVLTEVSAIMILIAGTVCFVLQHSVVSTSAIMQQHTITQRA